MQGEGPRGHGRRPPRLPGTLPGRCATLKKFTVGAGAGRGADDSVASHVFVGLPVPLVSFDFTPDGPFAMWGTPGHGGRPRYQVYVEPAYRRFLRPHPGGQLELMLKVSVGLTSGWH
jgi:hypothetical protein